MSDFARGQELGEPIAGYVPDPVEEQRWRDEQLARKAQERRGQALGAALNLAAYKGYIAGADVVADAKIFDDFLAGK